MSTAKYQHVVENVSEREEEAVYFLPKSEHQETGRSISRPSALLSTLVLIGVFMSGVVTTLLGLSLQSHLQPANRWGSYESSFEEEKLFPKSAMQLEKVKFKTPVDFELDGHEFLVTEPGEKMYVGDPSPEIDRNWQELLWGRYFSISEDEAKDIWGDDHEKYKDVLRSGYTGGLDMFHQLHCLNQIRQALHADYYHPTPIHGPVHTDHCINSIRQALMCWGSTTIVPLKYFEGYHGMYVKTDAMHTCRKWEPIREFVTARFNGSLVVKRPNGRVDGQDHAF